MNRKEDIEQIQQYIKYNYTLEEKFNSLIKEIDEFKKNKEKNKVKGVRKKLILKKE